MASGILQTRVPNLFEKNILKNLATGFISNALAGVNPDQEIIRKVEMIVTKSLFRKDLERNCFACFSRLTDKHEFEWDQLPDNISIEHLAAQAVQGLEEQKGVPAEIESAVRQLAQSPALQAQFDELRAKEADFLARQKQVVEADLGEGLEQDWETLHEKLGIGEPQQPGSLAFIGGQIELKIHTVDKATKDIKPTKTSKTDFRIVDEATAPIENAGNN